ncbi:MAG: hypothetical protein ABI627_18865 [Polyangiaceae bacterium]
MDEPGSWAAECRIRRPCKEKAAPLEPCEPGKAARAWADFVATALDFQDQVIDVSGRFEVSAGFFSTGVGCAKGICCNSVSVGTELYLEQQSLRLEGFGCGGDESRLCCNVLAAGQQVVAHGRLIKFSSMPRPAWTLRDVSICALAN